MVRRSSMMRVFVAVVVSICWISSASAEWNNALEPKGPKSSDLTIVRDGQPIYSIAIPANPTGPEKKAADDLRHWLKEMTSADLPLAVSPSAKAIRIATDATAPDEQYTIAVDGDALLLTGGPGRGVINAVYALLEEDMGCRWYTKDSFRQVGDANRRAGRADVRAETEAARPVLQGVVQRRLVAA